MSTTGIFKTNVNPIWIAGKVVIKSKRHVEARPSGNPDTYAPHWHSTSIAPKALSTWSS